jgi:hypothetical protein
MPERPVDICSAAEPGEVDGVGHFLEDPFGADCGCFFEPRRGAFADREECLLGGSACTDAVVTGNPRVMAGEVRVVDGGSSRGGASMPGYFDRTPVVECADDDLIGTVVQPHPHALTQ